MENSVFLLIALKEFRFPLKQRLPEPSLPPYLSRI
jgi:hypothetical protein